MLWVRKDACAFSMQAYITSRGGTDFMQLPWIGPDFSPPPARRPLHRARASLRRNVLSLQRLCIMGIARETFCTTAKVAADSVCGRFLGAARSNSGRQSSLREMSCKAATSVPSQQFIVAASAR